MYTEVDRVQEHIYRAKRYHAPATLTLAEWQQTITDFNGICAYCQEQPFFVMEHFLPVKIAGTHVKNCLPACQKCNVLKNNRTGETLYQVFGQETVERLQRYLMARIEQPDAEPLPTRKSGSRPRRKSVMTDEKKERNPEEMLNANDAGKILGVSGKTMIRLMEDEKFPGYKIGGVWKFKRGEIEYYRDSQRYRPGGSNTLDNAA